MESDVKAKVLTGSVLVCTQSFGGWVGEKRMRGKRKQEVGRRKKKGRGKETEKE